MPTVDNGAVTYTETEIAEYNAAAPELAYFFELIRDYALEQGGEVLAVWQKLQGPLFGENQTMKPSVAAQQLGIPVSDIISVWRQTLAVVRPVWTASPQYAAVRAAKANKAPQDSSQ